MKAEMDENGVLTLIPETGLESYALRQWCKENEENANPNILIKAFEE